MRARTMWRYAVTSFLGAFLLFGVELLMGKFVLPIFGGTPAVWTACLLFFQTALLFGYAYAHWVQIKLSLRRQAVLHMGLLAGVVVLLVLRGVGRGSPLTPGPTAPLAGGDFTGQALWMLALTVGAPFAVLAATAPLVQSWFAAEGSKVSPYRLYALSNAGSVAALLAYPTLVEPFLSRRAQAWAFAAAFVAFALACAGCARRAARQEQAPEPEPSAPQARPGLLRRVAWATLAGCASVLLVATTSELSMMIAAGPFLWIIPMTLYLASFIICFEYERLYARVPFVLLFGGFLFALIKAPFDSLPFLTREVACGGVLFASCMVLHGELYRLRPPARALSAFYLQVSLGGALGGAFVAAAAPRLFRGFAEYPLALGVTTAVAAIALLREPRERQWERTGGTLATLGAAALGFLMWGYVTTQWNADSSLRWQERNALGVLRVCEVSPEDPEEHRWVLYNGAIQHGSQYARDDKRRVPSTYYTVDSGLGQVVARQRAQARARGEGGIRLGVLGLGVGTAAALAEAGDRVRFYELDPLAIRLARGEGGFFHYLDDSAARVEIIQGDARRMLEDEAAAPDPPQFDVLAVDVFSGDAIPVHLLTEEAVRLFLRFLAPGGLLALHISNQHLNLGPMAMGLAERLSLNAFEVMTQKGGQGLSSRWVILGPPAAMPDPHTFKRKGVTVFRSITATAWTDERSSLLRAFDWD